MNGFPLRLVLKQRHKRTRKWSIEQRINQVANVNPSISQAQEREKILIFLLVLMPVSWPF